MSVFIINISFFDPGVLGFISLLFLMEFSLWLQIQFNLQFLLMKVFVLVSFNKNSINLVQLSTITKSTIRHKHQ